MLKINLNLLSEETEVTNIDLMKASNRLLGQIHDHSHIGRDFKTYFEDELKQLIVKVIGSTLIGDADHLDDIRDLCRDLRRQWKRYYEVTELFKEDE